MNIPRLRTASGELLHLDMMRFVASVGIVVHHSVEYFLPVSHRVNIPTYGLGLFVDLFFVISGFVIAYIYHDRVSTADGYAKFLQRRVGRLIPLHWLTLAIWVIVWGVIALAGLHANHSPDLSPLCVADTAFLMHAFVRCGNHVYLNEVTWSVSAEMIMYLAFPIIAWIALSKRSLLILLFAVSLVMAVLPTISASFASSYALLPPPLLRAAPSFLLGAILFFYKERVARLPLPYATLPIAVVAMITAMVTAGPALLTLLLVYLVATSAVHLDLRGKVSSFVRILAPFGQLTYSIYMWHLLFLIVLVNMIGDKILHGRFVLPLTILAYICIGIVSYFSYFFIETPARRYIDQFDIAKIGSHLRGYGKWPMRGRPSIS